MFRNKSLWFSVLSYVSCGEHFRKKNSPTNIRTQYCHLSSVYFTFFDLTYCSSSQVDQRVSLAFMSICHTVTIPFRVTKVCVLVNEIWWWRKTPFWRF